MWITCLSNKPELTGEKRVEVFSSSFLYFDVVRITKKVELGSLTIAARMTTLRPLLNQKRMFSFG
jgi:hypothetical protein